jgi:hypothetical protein
VVTSEQHIDKRRRAITTLLPLISGLRHSKNPLQHALAEVLQYATGELECLNSIEMRIDQSKQAIGEVDALLRTDIESILQRE